MLRHPPEGDSFQIAEKQRRITDRRQAAAHVRNQKNKKYHVMGRHTVFVHPQPGANQQHGRARGAKQIGHHRAQEQEGHVRQRRGLAFHTDVNAAGYDEQRADQNDETRVFVGCVPYAFAGIEANPIINQGHRAQHAGHFRVMFAPPAREKQRRQRHRREQKSKRQNHPGVRMNRMFHAATLRTCAKQGQPETAPTPPLLISCFPRPFAISFSP